MRELSTLDALKICAREGYPVTGQTIRMWCQRHKIGEKEKGQYKISEKALLEQIQNAKAFSVKNEGREFKNYWRMFDAAELPECACGCGRKVSRPQNKFINGHSGYPRKAVK